jgi:Ca2+/Na+ antiporter
MLKGWMHDIRLAIQARSGVTPAFLVGLGIAIFATLTAFAFLCVAAYDWLSLQWGGVVAGLVMAGIFVLVALIAVIAGASARRRARERAILERAARAHATPWLFDPKVLGIAVQAGRAFGWERIVPLALLGFLAAQWVRPHRRPEADDDQPS